MQILSERNISDQTEELLEEFCFPLASEKCKNQDDILCKIVLTGWKISEIYYYGDLKKFAIVLLKKSEYRHIPQTGKPYIFRAPGYGRTFHAATLAAYNYIIDRYGDVDPDILSKQNLATQKDRINEKKSKYLALIPKSKKSIVKTDKTKQEIIKCSIKTITNACSEISP